MNATTTMHFIVNHTGKVDPALLGLPNNPEAPELYLQTEYAVARYNEVHRNAPCRILELDAFPGAGRRFNPATLAVEPVPPVEPAPQPELTNENQLEVQETNSKFENREYSTLTYRAFGFVYHAQTFERRARPGGGTIHSFASYWTALQAGALNLRRMAERKYLLDHYESNDLVRFFPLPQHDADRAAAGYTPEMFGELVALLDELQIDDAQFGEADLRELSHARLADAARTERNLRLEVVLWKAERHRRELDAVAHNLISATTLSEPEYLELLTYIRALQNIPEQSGFPHSIAWPAPPGF